MSLFVHRHGILKPPAAGGYDSASEAIFAAFTTPPSDTRKGQINTLVLALKAASVWTKILRLYVHAAADEQAARIDWKNPGTNTFTATNSPSFTADLGFGPNGSSTAYLTMGNGGYATFMTQDDNHMGAWLSTVGTIGGNGMYWTRDSSPAGNFSMLFNAGVNGMVVRLADSSTHANGVTFDETTVQGYHVATRRDSTNIEFYRNGSSNANTTNTSEGLGGGGTYIFQGSSQSDPDMRARISHLGTALSDTEVSDMHTAFNTYLGSL